MAFLNKGDKVLIPNPGYPTYTSVTKLVQAKSIFYNLSEKNKWQPDIEKLFKMNVSGVKIMWLNYPNMPTGADFNHIVLQKIINWANKNDHLNNHLKLMLLFPVIPDKNIKKTLLYATQ